MALVNFWSGQTAFLRVMEFLLVSIALPLDASHKPTSNTVEFQAAGWALESFGYGLLLLCTNSRYVFLGATRRLLQEQASVGPRVVSP